MDSITKFSQKFSLTPESTSKLIQNLEKGYEPAYLSRFGEVEGLREHQLRRFAQLWQQNHHMRRERRKYREQLAARGELDKSLLIKIEETRDQEELRNLKNSDQTQNDKLKIAQTSGLQPLADQLWSQNTGPEPLETLIAPFLNPEKNLETSEAALKMLRSLLVPRLYHSRHIRSLLREYFLKNGKLHSQKVSGVKDKKRKFTSFRNFEKVLEAITPTTWMQLMRGERKGILDISLKIDDESAIKMVIEKTVHTENQTVRFFLESLLSETYHQLIKPAILSAFRRDLRRRSEEFVIQSCENQLEQLLRQPHIPNKVILGIDPDSKGHWHMAVLDVAGHVRKTEALHINISPPKNAMNETEAQPTEQMTETEITSEAAETPQPTENEISPVETTPSTNIESVENLSTEITAPSTKTESQQSEEFEKNIQDALNKLASFITEHTPDVIVLVKNKYGLQARDFIMQLASQLSWPLSVILVSPSGMNLLTSAGLLKNELAGLGESFLPAVALARRARDPLEELLYFPASKLYLAPFQSMVNPEVLQKRLDPIVRSAVARLNLNPNTAPEHLLRHIPGLNDILAESLVRERAQNGPFKTRQDLRRIPGMTDFAFEQCVGFFRIPDGPQPLDATDLHPRRYEIVRRIAENLQMDFMRILKKPELLERVDKAAILATGVKENELNEVIDIIGRPSHATRQQMILIPISQAITKISDVKPGMILTGRVSHTTDYGAFVDLGLDQDGLIHKTEMSVQTVKDPSRFLKLGQTVSVKVISVDIEKKRLHLTLKFRRPFFSNTERKNPRPQRDNRRSEHSRREEKKPFSRGDARENKSRFQTKAGFDDRPRDFKNRDLRRRPPRRDNWRPETPRPQKNVFGTLAEQFKSFAPKTKKEDE